MEVIVKYPSYSNKRYKDWEGEVVGISGQFLAVRLLYDPLGNKCGKLPLFFASPLELFSPIDWEAYRVRS